MPQATQKVRSTDRFSQSSTLLVTARFCCIQHSFTCWHFTITHGNTTTKTIYMQVDEFPAEKDGCDSAESCGLQKWECRVADNPLMVGLKWHYPIREVLYSCMGMLFIILLGTSALISFFRERTSEYANKDDKASENEMEYHLKEVAVPDEYLQSNIPFFSSEQSAVRQTVSNIIRRPPTVYSRPKAFTE